MKRIFGKIVSGSISTWQLILVGISAFAGLLLLWLPLMLFFDVRASLNEQKELFNDQLLVINKRVGMLGALGLGSTGFSEGEIEELKALKGVSDIGPFRANTFKAHAVADFGAQGPVMKTEMFFESIPDRFIDQIPGGWFWREGETEVPIIIPSDYLALYNFGFAPGQDLPQISRDLAKMSSFTIEIGNGISAERYEGRIAGFSDRINTILTPEDFIVYGNQKFGENAVRKPSRLVIETADTPALEVLMKEKNYETNKDKLTGGKEKKIAQNVLSLAMAFGLFVVLISLGSFIQFSDLLIARSQEQLRSMHYLGFSRKTLAHLLYRRLAIFIGIIALFATTIGLFIRWKIADYYTWMLPDGELHFPKSALILLFTVIVAYLLTAYANVRIRLRRI